MCYITAYTIYCPLLLVVNCTFWSTKACKEKITCINFTSKSYKCTEWHSMNICKTPLGFYWLWMFITGWVHLFPAQYWAAFFTQSILPWLVTDFTAECRTGFTTAFHYKYKTVLHHKYVIASQSPTSYFNLVTFLGLKFPLKATSKFQLAFKMYYHHIFVFYHVKFLTVCTLYLAVVFQGKVLDHFSGKVNRIYNYCIPNKKEINKYFYTL